MRNSLTILHLSDIQFGRNHRFGRLAIQDRPDIDLDTLFGRLLPEFESFEAEGVRPDIVVVSGDLAESGSKTEFADAGQFLDRVAVRLGIPRSSVAIIPGNHDINWMHSEAYFANCTGDGSEPRAPYWPKWKNYAEFFGDFYKGVPGIEFTEAAPWTLTAIPELKVVVAGLNSTIAETHKPDSHYGWVGEQQLNWFHGRLAQYVKDGWFRLGLVHHNYERGPTSDDENLRDAHDLRRVLGTSLNLLLHGHTHSGSTSWMSPTVPVISTGSAALKQEQRPTEIGNQYQIVRVYSQLVERILRRYDPLGKRWIGDTRESEGGDEWRTSVDVSFRGVSASLRAISEDKKQEDPDSAQIVLLNKSLSTEQALQRLANLPRVRLNCHRYHEVVRQEEQRRFVSMLGAGRAVWLVADWAQGKDDFLSCAVPEVDGANSVNMFRLNCGSVSDCGDLITTAETQLGLSFQEFLAAVAALPYAILQLDDLPQVLAAGRERDAFDVRLSTIFDFCPNLRVIITCRQVPRTTKHETVVELRPLDALDVKEYISAHPRYAPSLVEPETLEQIHAWSGGLPMHLDRLLERLDFLTLSEILADQPQGGSSPFEQVPHSLVSAIQSLATSTDSHTQASFRLLKVLTVLRDGETFETVRRFYQRQPFYPSNIEELLEHALIEVVPLVQSAPHLGLVSPTARALHESPRLIQVPRQVRDYLNSKLEEGDKEEIIWASMSFFFGQQWWKKVRLRRTIDNAYSQTALSGPGNEHVIVRLILVRAFERRDYKRAAKYAIVFVGYCSKLVELDRYRDVVIACVGIVDMLAELADRTPYMDVLYMYGRSLHMIGKTPKAIEILERILGTESNIRSKEFKADVLLSLALCYESSERETDAIKAARQVIELVEPESHDFFQAQSIIASQSLAGSELITRLRELELNARNVGRKVAADNIALDLARKSSDVDEAIGLLQRVLRPDGDNYNRARAIIEKASILSKHKRLSELPDGDRQILTEAYGYCYAQRFGNLLDRCHRVLWLMCKREGVVDSLLRLFRFSSFIWRIRGEETREREYLLELAGMPEQPTTYEKLSVQVETVYYERRRAALKLSV